MNFNGILIGLVTFVFIGIFHTIVIKAEYYFGKRIWIVFLLVGLATIAGSLFIPIVTPSAILAIFGFCCLWSINEIIEQEERVASGNFPHHPTRPHHAHIRSEINIKKTGDF
jgi:hypothetical protein